MINEKKFKLFRQPKVDLKNFEKNKPVNIEIKIDLEPDIKITDFKKININKYEIDLSKKNTEELFKNFIKSQKVFKKIKNNREIKKSDRVIIDFESNNQEIPDYLKSQKNIAIDTNSNQEILPGINSEIISKKLKQGDQSKLKFDLCKLLKSDKFKNVEFNIKIISIEESEKFELSQEYFDKNGLKNEDDLKEKLKSNALLQYNQGVKQIEKKQMMDILNKEYNFDLPYGILEEDFNEIWHRIEHAKKDGSLDEDDKSLSDDELKKRYKKISERRVKLGVLLQSISKKENIKISEDELSKGIIEYASQYPGQEKQIMEYLKKNPSAVESIRGPMLEEKIIESIVSKANISLKKINEEQYKKLEQETFDIKKD